MKTWFVLLAGALFASTALAADGKALFEAHGCTACHSADKELVGPPLKDISAAYAKKRDALVTFLSGKGDPRVDPDRFAVMKPSLEKTKALTKAERGALADFILGHE